MLATKTCNTQTISGGAWPGETYETSTLVGTALASFAANPSWKAAG
jgi:hypothetical protein